MRIRQIALVAHDLEAALADLRAVLALGAPFEDPGVGVFGLRNGVFPVGEHFLEVVSPKQESTSAGRFLDRRGDGGYMVIFQTHDLAAQRQRLASRGVRTVWEIELPDIGTIHLHPRDTGAAIVSIDEARPWESWRWAGPDWRSEIRTSRISSIAGVEIQCDNPASLAARWKELFELRAGDGPDSLRLEDDGIIRFVPVRDGRGEGIRSVLLRGDMTAVREAAEARGIALDDDGAVALSGVRFVSA